MKSNLLKLIRPHQWLKNVFVMIPMFFGGSLLDPSDIRASVVTFFAFSFIASSVYCFNDIIDVEADRRHPVKCKRPIASGAISVRSAWALMALMFLLSVGTVCLLDTYTHVINVGLVILIYYILNILYCSKLKQYAIVDVCIIAFGFVLRVLAGGFATDIALSKWLVLMTFLLTLFLSFAKRRDDVLRMNETGEPPRKNTIRYNLTFINQAITITASVTLVCYIMYTVSPEVVNRFHSDLLYLTSVFVLLGLLRYIQITVVDKRSGDPTKMMLRDRFTQCVVLLWALTFLVLIYVIK
ncbi:decaprenyl-phosphate phosphoribosyltransferase [Xylanibacter rarus]|jgi:decaprenyl-phosphate phosphoribosyltransferase|uniref:Prenyltransferase UbiA n=1 Tax=Xylanibacter rarus TaxID=1676614 RepID=A0A8E1UQD1_9BACT|nr:decaprenyl-phosphate phosphoribosyltransferase [Xylanibacter rarus]KOO67804.1 prenyltransferase UbiA [Xylanibacter rarus]HJH75719.1 decaprenyl-phosphate phosphoribosyltransferase [Prevotellaceae bacterium]